MSAEAQESDVAPLASSFETLLAPLADPFLLLRLDGQVVAANAAARSVCGPDPVGRSFQDLVEGEPGRLLTLWAGSSTARPGAIRVGEHQFRCDGARVPGHPLIVLRCAQRRHALRPFEQLDSELQAQRDAAMRARVEGLLAELQRTNEALVRSNEDLDRFAAAISHDLRSPLNLVAGFAELLEEELRGTLEGDTQEYLDGIVRNVLRVRERIGELLEVARVDAAPAGAGAARLREVLAEVEEELRPDIDAAGAVLHAGELPAVDVTPAELAQIMQNLIANALKFRDPDRPLEIMVSARPIDGRVEVSVADTGRGVAREDRETIFDLFQRGGDAAPVPGTGIGLATVRRIVERYGGHITVDETPGGGATFRFTLPSA